MCKITSHDEALCVGVDNVYEDGVRWIEPHEAGHTLEQGLRRVQPCNATKYLSTVSISIQAMVT